jgi:hypothetical protein
MGGTRLVALLLGGYAWYHHQVTAAYNRGKADEAEHVRVQAIELKASVDALTAQTVNAIRSRTDAEDNRISGFADALRVRGPGRATCAGAPGVPGAASGPEPTAGPPGAPVDRVSYPEWEQLIGMPFAPTVDFAKGHDQCQADLRAYRERDAKLKAAWDQVRAAQNAKPKRRGLLQRLSPF